VLISTILCWAGGNPTAFRWSDLSIPPLRQKGPERDMAYSKGALNETARRVGKSNARRRQPSCGRAAMASSRAATSSSGSRIDSTPLRSRLKRESSQVLEVVSRIGQLFQQDRQFIPQDTLVSRNGDLWISLLGSRVVEEGFIRWPKGSVTA
jgi:hypothetical protein